MEQRQMLVDVLEQRYCFDPVANLWTPRNREAFSYSDGDEVEERIAAIIQGSLDRASDSIELQKSITDWPSNYHLNARRANLLRPVADLLTGRILEIGAGTGAITRYLGERGATVVAVEGSIRRASIAARRCADLSNVLVVADDFSHFSRFDGFDVVTLIGVLEYARRFFSTGGDQGDPIDLMIERARSMLRPGGLLIVAIENQLGLKYFAGTPEDHLGVPMAGIEDRYGAHSVVTFGRAELRRRLAGAALVHQQWWYPQPDYKLPVSQLSERAFDHPVDLSSICSEAVGADPQLADELSFALERAWRPVFRNGLAADLANSFLVLASEQPIVDTPLLAVHYGMARRPEFSKQVRFEWVDGKVVVRRLRLHADRPPPGSSIVSLQLSDEDFIAHPNWHERLVDVVGTVGWGLEQWTQWAQVWLQAILRLAKIDPARVPEPQQVLPGELLDAVPRNLIFDHAGQARFIDQEWRLEGPLELGFLVYRGLFVSLFALKLCAHPAVGVGTGRLMLFRHFVKSIGWTVSADDLRRYAALEQSIQQCVSNGQGLDPLALYAPIDIRRSFSAPEGKRSPSSGVGGQTADEVTQAAQQASVEIASRDAKLAELSVERSDLLAQLQSARELLASVRQNADVVSGRQQARIEILRRENAWSRESIQSLGQILVGMSGRAAGGSASQPPRETGLRARLRDAVWTFRSRGRRAELRALRRSTFFDPAFYLRTYKDVRSSGMDPALHYLRFGSAEGRNPGPYFSTRAYLAANPDVAAAGLSALGHFELAGREERRPLGFIHPALEAPAAPIVDGPGASVPDTELAFAGAGSGLPHSFADGNIDVPQFSPAATVMLVVSDYLPLHDQQSGGLRLRQMITILASLGHPVVFVSALDKAALPGVLGTDEGRGRYEQALRQVGVVGFVYGLAQFRALLARTDIDVRCAWLSFPQVAESYLPLLRQHRASTRVIYDMVDFHALRMEREAAVTGDASQLRDAADMQVRELALVNSADVTVAVSNDEKRMLLELAPTAVIDVIPNIFEIPSGSPPGPEGRRDILFIGGFWHQPNGDAVNYFAHAIWPGLHAIRPDCRFIIAGSNPGPEVIALGGEPGIEVLGFVQDLKPLYDSVRVCIAPLRYGAGMKGKVGQAMASGVPVVATSIGAEGLLFDGNGHIFVADEPERFAEHIRSLLDDDGLWSATQQSALSFMKRHFSVDGYREKLGALFNV